ncbi:MAG: NUDIX hydrolase [Acidimicrobiales bacterium]
MATRIEWLDDPNAPEVNNIIPAASVVVANDKGEILLIQRSDNGNWTIPGGAMEHGESLTQTAIREAKEETGYDIEVTGLVGIYTNPNRRIEYTSNGEVRQEFSVCYIGRVVGGEPTANDEATRIEWVLPDKLDDLGMADPIRQRIARYLSSEAGPYLG